MTPDQVDRTVAAIWEAEAAGQHAVSQALHTILHVLADVTACPVCT